MSKFNKLLVNSSKIKIKNSLGILRDGLVVYKDDTKVLVEYIPTNSNMCFGRYKESFDIFDINRRCTILRI